MKKGCRKFRLITRKRKGRKQREDSRSLAEYLKKPNQFAWIVYGGILILILLTAGIVGIFLKKRKKRREKADALTGKRSRCSPESISGKQRFHVLELAADSVSAAPAAAAAEQNQDPQTVAARKSAAASAVISTAVSAAPAAAAAENQNQKIRLHPDPPVF